MFLFNLFFFHFYQKKRNEKHKQTNEIFLNRPQMVF